MDSLSIIDDTSDAARQRLGVSPEAGDAEIRQAYLAQVRLHPPDRDPDIFEKVRDAYDILRDPRSRAKQVLASSSPMEPLSKLIDGLESSRRFVGPDLWLELLKEKRS